MEQQINLNNCLGCKAKNMKSFRHWILYKTLQSMKGAEELDCSFQAMTETLNLHVSYFILLQMSLMLREKGYEWIKRAE